MRPCPHCAAEISDYVIKCVHCDTWLVKDPPVPWHEEPDEVARRATEQAAAESPAPAAPAAAPEVVPVVPGGGFTLEPVIIVPDTSDAPN